MKLKGVFSDNYNIKNIKYKKRGYFMNKNDFNTTKELNDFTKECICNEFGKKEIYMELWKKSETVDDFKKLVWDEEKLLTEQATGEMFKYDWNFKRKILGNKQIKLNSDAGGIKVGTDNFSIIIPNGSGDGITRFAILNEDEINKTVFEYFTLLEGTEINVYEYDCGDKVLCTLRGRYGSYYSDGFIVLVKYNN